jgi:thymidylate synthase ThyX
VTCSATACAPSSGSGSRPSTATTRRRSSRRRASPTAWHEALGRAEALHRDLVRDHPEEAQYVVPFAFRIRYSVQINARAAMQMIELRSTPQGHPQYRSIVQAMHRAIADVAGHTAVADAMVHVDHGVGDLERLASERALDRGAPVTGPAEGPSTRLGRQEPLALARTAQGGTST